MSKKQILFSGVFLYLNDNKLQINDFKSVLKDGHYEKKDGSKIQLFNISYEGNFLKIVYGDGSVGSRPPFVYNMIKDEQEENPRDKNQVEPKETFAIIDFDTSFMWISNSKKKSFLISLIKSYFATAQITAKDIYDELEFINTLKKLDKIKVSTTPNLFSQTGILSDTLSEEINGYGATSATLSFSYNQTLFDGFLRDKIKNLFNQKGALKSIVISGRDEKDLGMLFNSEGFSRKIDIEALVDENEMFLADDVFREIIKKIEDEKK